MTYHMSRVAHWWANDTVAFYPTNIQRQLYSSPLAEYLILQFFVLGNGSDRLANLVQWFCFGGCAVAMSLVAARLTSNRLTQYLAAFLVLTTPIAILESTSTQNDVVCAFFVAATLYFLYRDATVFAGLSFGLAVLTKSTAGLFILPFLFLLFFRESFDWRASFKVAKKLAAIGSLVLVLNVPHWLRNWQTFHNPLGFTTQVNWIQSQTLAPGPFACNLMRHLSLDLLTPDSSISRVEEETIRAGCKSFGADPDDPRNTFKAMQFSVGTMSDSDNGAANPLQIALLIAATSFFLLSRRLRRYDSLVFVFSIWVSFLLMAWKLSWSPWQSRIHTPFVVLASLPIAVFLNETRRHSRFFSSAIVVILATTSLLPLLHNNSRAVLTIRRAKTVFTRSRSEQYFVERPTSELAIPPRLMLFPEALAAMWGLHCLKINGSIRSGPWRDSTELLSILSTLA